MKDKKPYVKNCIEDMQLTYYPHFYPMHKADALFRALMNKIEWHQEQYQMFGKTIASPRLVAWYGDPEATYTYSGIQHQPKMWLPELFYLRQTIERRFHIQFNAVLVNLYRNEADSMGYHADNEPELGREPIIASLSLGAERKFNLRHKEKKSLHKMRLKHGSLLIMSGLTQHHWVHCIPKEKGPTAARINLTFRKLVFPIDKA